MEWTAYIKNLRISPKKLRFLLGDIKKRKPSEVLDYLFYTPTKSAKVFYKAIKSAIDNAKNNLKLNENDLVFKTLIVEEGHKLRRFRAGGRGMAKRIIRRYSHIKIVLKSTQNKKVVQQSSQKPVDTKIKEEKTLKVNPAKGEVMAKK